MGLEATRYIIGERLKNFVERDPLTREVTEFCSLEETKEWEKLCNYFLRYVSVHREAMWDGKEDVASLTKWKASINHFFITQPVINTVTQTMLAVSTFRGHAQHWWFSKMQVYPQLVVSFAQLLQWIRDK